MATELFVKKSQNVLMPVDQVNADVLDEIKNGEYKAVLIQPRNIQFHKKFFALVKVAYDAWEPEEVKYKDVVVQKNLERFRKDLTIMCGYFDTVVNIKNEVRLEAKSISFANIDDAEFSELYSRFIDVVLQKVLLLIVYSKD